MFEMVIRKGEIISFFLYILWYTQRQSKDVGLFVLEISLFWTKWECVLKFIFWTLASFSPNVCILLSHIPHLYTVYTHLKQPPIYKNNARIIFIYYLLF